MLLSGFEPFGGSNRNASAEIVRALHLSRVSGHRIEGVVLPCVFGEAPRLLARRIRELRPALVVCLGEAGRRRVVTPELRARNRDDARLPDNAGRQPRRRPVVLGAPASHGSTLPVGAIVAELKREGIPAAVSWSAGSYVCNHVFYSLMDELASARTSKVRTPGGFIHVPALPDRGRPAIPLRTLVRAIRLAIATSVKDNQGKRVSPRRRRGHGG